MNVMAFEPIALF